MVPLEESPPKAHKPFVEARRAQVDHHRELRQREYTSVHEENRHLRDEVKDLDKVVKLLKEENKRLLKQLKDKAKDHEWLETLLSDESAKLKALEKSKEQLRKECDDAKSSAAEVKATLITKEQTIDSLKDEIVVARKAQQTAQEQSEALEAEVAAAQKRVEEVRREEAAKAAKFEDEVAAVTRQLRQVERTLAESDARVDEAQAKVKDAEKRGDDRCEVLRKKIASLKSVAEDEWSGSDDSDGAPKRRKAVRPNAAAAAAERAKADLEKKLQAIQTEREAAASETCQTIEAIRHERDALASEKVALEASRQTAVASLEDKLAAAHEQHRCATKKQQALEADLRSEIASKADDHASERQLRMRVQDELGEAHDEISALRQKVEEAKNVAIQLEASKEQRRVADDFTSRATQDLAARVQSLGDELQAANDDRDDAVELAREKAVQLVEALEAVNALQDELEDLRQNSNLRDADDARLLEEMQQLRMAVAAERVAREEADAARDLQSRSHRGVDDALDRAQKDMEQMQLNLASRDSDIADLREALDAEMNAKAELQEQLAAAGNNATDDSGMNVSVDGGAGDVAAVGALQNEVSELRAQLAAAEVDREAAIESAQAWKNHAESTAAVSTSTTSIAQEADERQQEALAAADSRAAAAEARAAALERQLSEQAAGTSEEREALSKQHAANNGRLEKDKAELLLRLKAAESKAKEADKSLNVKVAALKKEQEAQKALKLAHTRELNALRKQNEDASADLRGEIERLKQRLDQADQRAASAVAKANTAVAAEREAKETLTKLQQAQLHW